MAAVHHTEIEFFGGPCDGHRQTVRGRLDELEFVTAIPLPFRADRSWLNRARASPTTSKAIYTFDFSLGGSGYHYLGTIPRQKPKRRSGGRRWLGWLRAAFERRRVPIFGKSRFAS